MMLSLGNSVENPMLLLVLNPGWQAMFRGDGWFLSLSSRSPTAPYQPEAQAKD
jgi:hypothetical protein